MKNYFIPYSGDKPAVILVNGHSMIILSSNPDIPAEELELVGADHIHRVCLGDSPLEERTGIERLSRDAHAGVVFAPAGAAVSDILRNLRSELPWIQ